MKGKALRKQNLHGKTAAAFFKAMVIIIIIIIIITLFREGNIIKLYNLFTIWPSITKKTRTTNIVQHAHKIEQINEIIFNRSF